jgi:hypothetical protein
MHVVGHLTPEEFWSQVDAGDEEVRRNFLERPVFAVRGWPGRAILSEWSFGTGIRSIAFLPAGWNGPDYSAATAQPRIDVLIDVLEPRRMIAERIGHEIFARRGEPPSLHKPDAPTPDSIIDLDVDGIDEAFEVWSSGEPSRAAGRVGGVTVIVESIGRPIGDIALERVIDIEPYIEERRSWIRSQRGEA